MHNWIQLLGNYWSPIYQIIHIEYLWFW